jgi:hypothetical protein
MSTWKKVNICKFNHLEITGNDDDFVKMKELSKNYYESEYNDKKIKPKVFRELVPKKLKKQL